MEMATFQEALRAKELEKVMDRAAVANVCRGGGGLWLRASESDCALGKCDCALEKCRRVGKFDSLIA